jgi:hypothetical protein
MPPFLGVVIDLAIILENLKNGYDMQVHLVKLGDNSIQVSSNKKGSLKLMGCLFYVLMIYVSYFLNLFLPNTPKPKSPEPKRSMLAGSGTAALTWLSAFVPRSIVAPAL